MKCERYFKLRNFHTVQNDRGDGGPILSVRPRGRAFKRDIGIWWAKFMEWYYTAISTNTPLTKDMCVDLALQSWKECDMDALKVQFPSSFEKFGGPIGATNMAFEYYDFSYQFDTHYWKIVAIESGFGRRREVKVGENDKVVVYWLGKPDLFICESGRYMPLDHKSKDHIDPRQDYQFKPHHQTAGYIVAAQTIADSKGLGITVDRCLVNIAARLSPSDNPRGGKPRRPRFKRVQVQYSQAELEEWKDQVVRKATRLRSCIENDEWLWNDNACHVYSGCEYRAIDSVPPASRPIVIQSQFTVGEPWISYEPEED